MDDSQKLTLKPADIMSVRFYCRTCRRFAIAVFLPTRNASHWRCASCKRHVEPEAAVHKDRIECLKEKGTWTVLPKIRVDENGNILEVG